MRGANKLKWTEKIENSVIDPPTISEGRLRYEGEGGVFVKHIKAY